MQPRFTTHASPGAFVDHDFFRCAAGRKAQGDGAQIGWQIGRRTLLVKRLLFGPVHEALENDRAIPNAAQRAGSYRDEVSDNVELGELNSTREVRLGWRGDADLANPVRAFDLEKFGVVCLGGFGENVEPRRQPTLPRATGAK